MNIRFWKKNKDSADKNESEIVVCARCKKEITAEEAVFIGRHRFCKDCAKPHQPTKEDRKLADAVPVRDNRTSEGDNSILKETFAYVASIPKDRNNEICDKFVAIGIAAFSTHTFDESSLEELSFDELCAVYNNIGWFAEKVMSGIKDNAAAYKRFLRKKLLQRLSSIPVYAVYATVTNLPFVLSGGSMPLYTDKAIAVHQLGNTGVEWLQLHEIVPETFERYFSEYLATGYDHVMINGSAVVKIEDIFPGKSVEAFGNICIESCKRMVDYMLSKALSVSKAKEENRELRQEEIRILNQQSWAASQSLLKDCLLVPADIKDGELIRFSVPCVQFPDGTKYLCLFTDQWAINGFYKRNVSCVSFPGAIKDNYEQIADDPSVGGILINPGREEYQMTKEMLKQLFPV